MYQDSITLVPRYVCPLKPLQQTIKLQICPSKETLLLFPLLIIKKKVISFKVFKEMLVTPTNYYRFVWEILMLVGINCHRETQSF